MIQHFVTNFFVFLSAQVLGVLVFVPLALAVGLTEDPTSPSIITAVLFLVGGSIFGGLILTALDRLTPEGD